MTTQLIASYLALAELKYFSANQLSSLIKSYACIKSLQNASDESLQSAGLSPAQADAARGAISDMAFSSRVEKSLDWVASAPENRIICFEDPLYPSLLKTIDQPPPCLYVLGNPNSLELPQLAMVGSRNASSAGKQIASWLAGELGANGFAICSGLAAGIDTEAHRGTLAANGSTNAVMGTGIDLVYPRSNRKLAKQIQTNGAVMTEFGLGSPPRSNHFPIRNRIISGMSMGVIVIEAALKSGSLVTARLAMEQNREVFAVPGSIFNPLSKGCHRLIRDGAKLVDSAESVVEELAGSLSMLKEKAQASFSSIGIKQAEIEGLNLCDKEKMLLDAIGYEQLTIEALATTINQDIQTISSMLIKLELRGLIEHHMGLYRRRTCSEVP